MLRLRSAQIAAALGIVFGLLFVAPVRAAENSPTSDEVRAAMQRAAHYFHHKVALHGGYVYFYSTDLEQRFGEGSASKDQIWVQPPGTPTVGMAYIAAYEATGDPAYLVAATDAGEALIYGQLQSGGWTNCIDFDPNGKRVSLYRNGKGKGRNYSSFDDGQSQSAAQFLVRLDRTLDFRNPKIHEAAQTALEAILAAQFENGAFPQVWQGPVPTKQPIKPASYPDYDWRTENRIKNYWDMYTLNDGLAVSVSELLIEAWETYDDTRYRDALVKLGDFLVLSQMPQPQPGWAQQYSYEMHPIWARKFEPPAIAGRESQEVLETLLSLYEKTHDAKYLASFRDGFTYLSRSRLPDGRLARYYELKSNRPLYMQRQGDVYSLTYDDSNLPDHYGWKTASDLEKLKARYDRLTGDKGSAGNRPGNVSPADIRTIIDSLDAQGRWIDTFQGEPLVGDQKFRPGDRYLSSATFSENLKKLATYLEQQR